MRMEAYKTMLKQGILHPQLLRVLGETGHMDHLMISDSGMPQPLGKERVDLAILPQLPRLLDVLSAVTDVLTVEKVFVAEEVKTVSPRYHSKLLETLKPTGAEIVYIPHAQLKELSNGPTLRASVRTGECTSYSTVILQAGVPYGGDDLT